MIDGLKKEWALTPEWIRAKCVTNATFPAMFKCILDQTVAWGNGHPDAKMPWMDPSIYPRREDAPPTNRPK
jgi:hypothetical protein